MTPSEQMLLKEVERMGKEGWDRGFRDAVETLIEGFTKAKSAGKALWSVDEIVAALKTQLPKGPADVN